MPYSPIEISNFKTGLVQERESFILANDAFIELNNAYVWREEIVRKQGSQSLGRFRRLFVDEAIPGNTQASPWSFNIFTTFSLAGNNPDVEASSVVIEIGTITFTDNGDGTLSGSIAGNSGTINYATGDIVLTHTAIVGMPATITYNYFPCFPVMGIKTRELSAINNEETIGFDTNFAYRLVGSDWESLPSTLPTTWSGTDSDFFWTTNFWTNTNNARLFWATNFINKLGNEIRYYDGITWTNFAPDIIVGGSLKLLQARILLPFRGRLVALNTIEGNVLEGTTIDYPQRIRWASIGNPTAADSWREDLRNNGNYIDIPTSQAIVSAGFVRDNLVVFCERSTWQLRYTGNVVQPFQIEHVNTELGAESTFSSVQFDTSLVGIGDKGIVECDSFQSSRIDDKILDFVYRINNLENGKKRVSGLRNFSKKLAYWAYPDQNSSKFPNKRLIFNYENGSWAIFDDSITSLGRAQPSGSKTWQEDVTWEEANFTWIERPALFPEVVGGNQRGFVFYLDSQTINDPSLSISGITGNDTTPTVITSIDHNLSNEKIIEISNVISPSEFETTLNGNRFSIEVIDNDTFKLFSYDPITTTFSSPQLDPATWTYLGTGKISIIDNFTITTKKFNFLEQGRRIKIGFVDVLMETTDEGEITLEILEDYNAVVLNENDDLFFNRTIFTNAIDVSDGSEKTMQRVYCNVRGTFLTLLFKLSDAQMNSSAASSNVQIDSFIIWTRPAESQLYTGAIQ